jgi:hypothetical protein
MVGTVPGGGFHRLPRGDGGATVALIYFFSKILKQVHQSNRFIT